MKIKIVDLEEARFFGDGEGIFSLVDIAEGETLVLGRNDRLNGGTWCSRDPTTCYVGVYDSERIISRQHLKIKAEKNYLQVEEIGKHNLLLDDSKFPARKIPRGFVLKGTSFEIEGKYRFYLRN